MITKVASLDKSRVLWKTAATGSRSGIDRSKRGYPLCFQVVADIAFCSAQLSKHITDHAF